MAMLQINLRPGRQELRQFGWIALIGFGVLGALIFWHKLPMAHLTGDASTTVALVLWGIGGVSALFSTVVPPANRPLYVGLIVVTYPIGYVLSHVLMALLFFGLFTPVGLVFRLIGRDSLHRRFEPDASTYWMPHRPPDTMKRYFRQF